MDQDLDQVLLLIATILGLGFALIFVLAWLEPPRAEAPAPLAAVDATDVAPGAGTPSP